MRGVHTGLWCRLGHQAWFTTHSLEATATLMGYREGLFNNTNQTVLLLRRTAPRPCNDRNMSSDKIHGDLLQ
jgi:hypothetical protein